MSHYAPIGFCYTVKHGTGCTCCNHEDYYVGLYLTKKAAEEQAQHKYDYMKLSSQYASQGTHAVVKLKYELSGRFIILNDEIAQEFTGFADDTQREDSAYYELPKHLTRTWATEENIAEELKKHFPDYEPPVTAYVTVTYGIRGFFAVTVVVDDDGLHEPFNDGFGSYETVAEAEVEAKQMAENEGIPYIAPPRFCIIRRTEGFVPGTLGCYAGCYGWIEHFGLDFAREPNSVKWYDRAEDAQKVADSKTWPGYTYHVISEKEWAKL